jgi:RimJ/RimL family protein N-acetyltransferase
MPTPIYPIETARLRIRPFAPDDLGPLIALYQIPEVLRFLYSDLRSDAEMAKVLEQRQAMTALKAPDDKLVLALELKESGTLIGEVVLVWLSEAHRSAEIGFILHPDFHGRGLAFEATMPLLRFAFEEMDCHRIIGRCDGRNAASARLMEKLGMRREAHFVENEFVKGEWTDELVYALRATAWRDLNA